MNNGKKMKPRAKETCEDPPSSDSWSEMDGGYVLVNEDVQEVRWVCRVCFFSLNCMMFFHNVKFESKRIDIERDIRMAINSIIMVSSPRHIELL